MQSKFIFILFFFSIFSFSQVSNLSSNQVPETLTNNANSVIRHQLYEIDIISRNQMKIKKTKTITVLNSKGLNNIDAVEFYDKSTKVKSIEALIYDSFGKEIKKLKRKDFTDQSIADGFSVYQEDRILRLNYTPIAYPFTVIYSSEIETTNTAFIPKWSPIDDYYESVEFSSLQINFPSNLGFKYKELNFANYTINKVESLNNITYTATNLKAVKNESYAPSFSKINPIVLFGLDYFSLEGIEGVATTWNDFGKWRYSSLLSDNEEIPINTKNEVERLVQGLNSPLEKAKKIYEYVQNKTRYVSIQVGIGGWKPMLATDVDRLGYGDCKALTNYTRVLLKSVGVDSYYTVVYGGGDKKSFETDFVCMQGNHIILALPVNNQYVFMECTSQTSPFGFNGNFTDDRFALIVKPDGGEIIKTENYNAEKSIQKTIANYSINEQGKITANLTLFSTGIQYDNAQVIEKQTTSDKDIYYKEKFSWFSNMKILTMDMKNDKDKIEFSERLSFTSDDYATINGDLMFLTINALNRNINAPQRYKNRENSFEISRGFYDLDEVEVELPIYYKIDTQPNDSIIESKFGKYTFTVQKITESKIKYNRSFLLYNGVYNKEDYDEWRKFNEQINKADNAKIVLKKIN